MNIALNRQEAIRRMTCRNTRSIRWTLYDVTIEWKYIKASQARNYDGTLAGDGLNPNAVVLQQMVWKVGSEPRYTNHWTSIVDVPIAS